MDTIFLKGLVFSGRHGVGAPERAKHQRFGVDVEIKQNSKDWNENIKKTYNYMDAHDIVRRIVEEESFKLIETLAERICMEILRDSKVQLVSITVSKLDLMPPAVTGVTVTRSR